MYATSGLPGIRRKIRNRIVAMTHSTSSIWARRCAIQREDARVIRPAPSGAAAGGPRPAAPPPDAGAVPGDPTARPRASRSGWGVEQAALAVPVVPGLLQ